MYTELKKFKHLDSVCAEELDIVNLGTGMGYYDFCYEDVSIKGFNFALTQQNLFFDYQLLYKYSFKLKRDSFICIVLPYFIFCADRIKEIELIYERYYFLLPKERVELYCKVSYEEWKSKNLSITNEDDSLRAALNSKEMEIQVENAIMDWEKKLQIVSIESGELTLHAQREIENSSKWLVEILEYCKDKQFEPVIIVPPMSQILLDKISIEFRKTHYYDVLEHYVPSDVRVLDYSKNRYFCAPQLYGWPGFLVKNAAKEFTKDVLKKLNLG